MKAVELVKDTVKGMLKRENRLQFYRYVAIGLSAVVIEFVSFNLLMMIDNHTFGDTIIFTFLGYGSLPELTVTGTNVCQSVSMLLGTIFSYTMNRIWSFKTKNPMLPEMVRFGLLFIFNLIITNIVLRLLQLTGMYDWMCKFIVQCMMVLWNFFIYKLVIFKPYVKKEKKHCKTK